MNATATSRPRFVDVLKRSRLFGGVPVPLVTRFARGASARTYDAGENVWRANDAARSFMIVQTGLVEIRRPTSNGEGATLGLFGPGDSIGDFAVVAVGVYPADAVASDVTTIVRVPAEPVLDAVHTEPSVARAITTALVERSRILRMKIDVMSAGPTPMRLARLFVHLMQRFGEERGDGWVRVPLRLSRAQLARLVGARVETVIRTVSTWRKKGWIEVGDDGYLAYKDALAALGTGLAR